jgi:DNA-binding response OmpR family regulator
MRTALIVEDDPDQADMTARLLREHGFRPLTAMSGEEGLGLARRVEPDVMLLDLMLPDIDGFAVCMRLRGEERTRRIPIVMVTALDGENHRCRGFRVGANAYLTKPFGADELLRAVLTAQEWQLGMKRQKVRGEIQLELNSETAFLQDVNEFLTSLYRETPLACEQIQQLRQAVMEMGQNAIEWGNSQRPEELVRITYRVCEDRVEIVVRDQGIGFDPTQLPHAASPDDPLAHMDVREKLGLREGGFGLMICRGMLDELRHNDRGNEVTLIKRFPEHAAPSPNGPGPGSKGSSAHEA